MNAVAPLGGKVRALRRRAQVTQVKLASELGISPSYLNLIEQNRRPLSAPLLLKLAEILRVDLKTFSTDQDTQRIGELLEVFADPLFDDDEVTTQEVRELAAVAPVVSGAIVRLYEAYRSAAQSSSLVTVLNFRGEEHWRISLAVASGQMPTGNS